MRLSGLSVENFKPFSKRIDIELGPLTVLIGRNSSGKSALARLPLLIGRALSSEAVSPVELDASGVDFGASFVDLIHNRVPHGAIGLGATFADGTNQISFHSTVQHVDEFMLQVVSRCVWSSDEAKPVTMSWLGREPLADPGHYSIEHAVGTSSEVKASFKGLLPTIVAPESATGKLTSSDSKPRWRAHSSAWDIKDHSERAPQTVSIPGRVAAERGSERKRSTSSARR